MEEFCDILDQLDSLISCYGLNSCVILLGDFNADVGDEGPWASTSINEQGWILWDYIHAWDFCSYHLHMNSCFDTHTYESKAHGSLSCIDHIIGPRNLDTTLFCVMLHFLW